MSYCSLYILIFWPWWNLYTRKQNIPLCIISGRLQQPWKCLYCVDSHFYLLHVHECITQVFLWTLVNYTPAPPEGGGILFYLCPSLRLSVLPSVPRYFSSHFSQQLIANYWWQKSDIWSQASYRYAILWEAFLDPSHSYFLFVDLVGFYTQVFIHIEHICGGIISEH